MSQWSVAKRGLGAVTAALMLFNFTGAGAKTATPTTGGETTGEETKIVFFRHGEKPSDGLGQLDCQGLNRALRLPEVLEKKFPEIKTKKVVIFAPDPGTKVEDDNKEYYYVRPLATIEPTAIKFGMPVDTKFGYSEIDHLQKELVKSQYSNHLIFVIWEHKKLIDLVRNIVKEGHGDMASVPTEWDKQDYDTILVLHVTQETGGIKVKADKPDSEGMPTSSLSKQCPTK
jgi:hypothetical protein